MASSGSAPSGNSTEGVRHVTGRLEPARYGICIDFEVSYISRAHSHFQERCLSLNMGTTRPLERNTSATCWKNWYRGYDTPPCSCFGYFPCSPTTTTPSTASLLPPSVSASAMVG